MKALNKFASLISSGPKSNEAPQLIYSIINWFIYRQTDSKVTIKIFTDMFHNVVLLGPGGKTVYQGSVLDAKEYFANLGCETLANPNPADYYVDVIGGNIKPKEGYVDVDLFRSWKSHF